MSIVSIQDILPFIEKPSRYLGCEKNAVKKDLNTVKLKFALAFPDLYEIGISHFGIQILYNILNKHKDIAAERVFSPALDLENALRETGTPLFSLESHLDLKDFDIIGFSLLYELNYTNVLTILDLAGIPFYAKDRNEDHPLIIAGGPCTFNPEPVADFFDVMVIGDGEQVIKQISETWLTWQDSGKDRITLLEDLSKIEGVYVPSFYTPVYDTPAEKNNPFNTTDLLKVLPNNGYPEKVRRAIISDLNTSYFPESPIVPFGKPVHDRLRIEICRGCSRGCRFCQAGMIYRPVRERTLKKTMEITKNSIKNTGFTDVSLLSLSTGDYSHLYPLMERLMCGDVSDKPISEHISVSLPSIRAGRLTPNLMNLIKMERKTGFTIAPEAGTDRLRKYINKGITEDDIIETVQNAFALGWKVIKLYFMVGLPTETDEDVTGIVNLVKKLTSIKNSGGKRPTINVSVTTFIPKSHTPFQWFPQISLHESMRKIFYLKDELDIKGVQFKWQDPKVSILEGIWARGDRRLAPSLIRAYKNGCKFDGWSDSFNFDKWIEAFSHEKINTDYYTARERTEDEFLPWDHIDTGIHKQFFIKELEKADHLEFSGDCRNGDCLGCGICDFKNVKPIIDTSSSENNINEIDSNTPKNIQTVKYVLKYVKTGNARFFGHLELINIFIRALQRIDAPLFYSKGFHPKPKISFYDTLPLGMESFEEYCCIHLTDHIKIVPFIDGLNNELPEGIRIESCTIKQAKSKDIENEMTTYLIKSPVDVFETSRLETYFSTPDDFQILKKNKKGKSNQIYLKEFVVKIEMIDSSNLLMLLKKNSGASIRPFEIIKKIFHLSDESVKGMNIIKVSTD